MTSGPIEKRLRECSEDDDTTAARAAKLLRAIPEPAPVSEAARRRALRAIGASSRNGRGIHLSFLQWAVLSVLVVSTAAASAKRIGFPTWFHRRAAVSERLGDATVVDPSPPAQVPSKATRSVVEEPPLPKAAGPGPSARARASSTKTTIVAVEEAKAEPVRPRLLSDPQDDSIPRVLPKLVYDADTYSVLLEVCVSSAGHVTQASVVRGQQPGLDREIVEAVQRWNYLPGETDGQPVDMCFPLVYRIQVQHD